MSDEAAKLAPFQKLLTETILKLLAENRETIQKLLSDKIDPISHKVGLLSDKIDPIRDRLSNILSVVQTDLKELRTTTEKISSDQSKTRTEIMERIDRLQDTVELAREDARVNWHTADTAINRAKNSRADIDGLHGLISAMERRYQILASLVDGLRKPETKKPDDQ